MIGHGSLCGVRLDMVPLCPQCEVDTHVRQEPPDSGRYECKGCGRSGFDLQGQPRDTKDKGGLEP